MVGLYKFMPISPRSNQIRPLATRQPLRFSWWRRSTFSGFLLKQLSYLLLATFLFVLPSAPVFAGRAYVSSLQYEHAHLCGSKIYDAGLLHRFFFRGLANTDLRKVEMWSCRECFCSSFTSCQFCSVEFGGGTSSRVAQLGHFRAVLLVWPHY